MMISHLHAMLRGCLIWLLALGPALPAQAATSLLIWPLAPVIESGQRASSVWLENLGNESVTLQIRVLAWDQREHRDTYQNQQQLIATPPFASIAPGARQLVRLTATAAPAAGTEQAFRILIDEIPTPEADAQHDAQSAPEQSAALKFQMRYSLPLFVYGEGLWGKEKSARARAASQQAEPALTWQVLEIDGRNHLQLRNTGTGHARLSKVRLIDANDEVLELSGGLLGYVLPGKQMRWALPEGRQFEALKLQATLDSKQAPRELPRQ